MPIVALQFPRSPSDGGDHGNAKVVIMESTHNGRINRPVDNNYYVDINKTVSKILGAVPAARRSVVSNGFKS